MDEEERRDAVKIARRVTAGVGALILSIIEKALRDGRDNETIVLNVVVQCKELCKEYPEMLGHVQHGLETGEIKFTTYNVTRKNGKVELKE